MHPKLLLILPLVFLSLWAKSQNELISERFYFTTGSDMILSFANVDYEGQEHGTILRWAPVFNPHVYYHFDYRDYFGFFAGLSLQNVGFIMDMPDQEDTRKKFRSYNLGIPIGVKFGVLDRSFGYAGLSLEFPFNYKEKTFVDGDKVDKTVVWFSRRTPPVSTSVLAGFRLPMGINIKFKYYLTEFFNRSFTTIENGVEVKPFRNFKANVFYFGLTFDLFRNKEFIHKEALDDVIREL